MEAPPKKLCRYERAIPSAFQVPVNPESRSVSTFFMYSLRYINFKPGKDPIQHSASDFLLLSPKLLDKEAATMSVQLHLPSSASVDSQMSYCGPVILESEEVEAMRKFTVWLFHLSLGKCFSLPTVTGDGLKNYYILPCKTQDWTCEVRPNDLIDWRDVETAIGSGLLYRQKVHFFGGYAKLETGDFDEADPPGNGRLRMRNGTYEEHELEDAIVTCANNGLPGYIAGILHDLSGSSVFPQPSSHLPMTYTEHYMKKCKYKLEYPRQPLLKGYRLLRAGNYVRRTSTVPTNGDVRKPWETMDLAPEVCVLHVGMKGKLCRGAMRLPSVLHSFEMTLVAAELRDQIGTSLSCFKVQEALTSGACESGFSYETLELLGDSVLNFAGGVDVYINQPSFSGQQLHAARHNCVSNKTLSGCGLACGLPRYIFAELHNSKSWVPPGPALEDLPQKPPEGQIIGLKTLADVVEALVGVYYLNGNLETALRAMAWLRVPISFPSGVPACLYEEVQERIRNRNVLGTVEVKTLEKKLGYQFKTKELLLSAFDYGHEIGTNETGMKTGGFEFQRLEFVGDAVLGFLITRQFVRLYPGLNPGRLNDLLQATMNRENFACVAISHGLHKYLQNMLPALEDQITLFAASVIKEGASPFGVTNFSSPREPLLQPYAKPLKLTDAAPAEKLRKQAVGDVVQTLAGAIFLDANLDIEIVWKAFQPLLQPLVTPETVMLHPRLELDLFCRKQGWKMSIQSVASKDTMEACIHVDQVLVASSKHEELHIATRLAAFKALRLLSLKTTAPQLLPLGKKASEKDGSLEMPASEKVGTYPTDQQSQRRNFLAYPHKVYSDGGRWQTLLCLAHPIFWFLKLLQRPQSVGGRKPVITPVSAF